VASPAPMIMLRLVSIAVLPCRSLGEIPNSQSALIKAFRMPRFALVGSA
jgi:hypothetical protein